MDLPRDADVIMEAGSFDEKISALVRQAKEGDPEAFASMVDLLKDKLHRQALFLAGDEHQALDLLQETMLETWKHLHRYDNRVRFFSWVCSIMHHRHYDWRRRLRVRAFVVFTDPPDCAMAAPSPSEISSDLDRARIMRHCLDQLPGKQRMVVYLRFYAGESLEGIAALARCSLGTVKSRLFHGLARLATMEKLKHLRTDA